MKNSKQKLFKLLSSSLLFGVIGMTAPTVSAGDDFVYCDDTYCYVINNDCQQAYCGLIPIPKNVFFKEK